MKNVLNFVKTNFIPIIAIIGGIVVLIKGLPVVAGVAFGVAGGHVFRSITGK